MISSLGFLTRNTGMLSPKQCKRNKKNSMIQQHYEITIDSLCLIGLLPTMLDTISNRNAM